MPTTCNVWPGIAFPEVTRVTVDVEVVLTGLEALVLVKYMIIDVKTITVATASDEIPIIW